MKRILTATILPAAMLAAGAFALAAPAAAQADTETFSATLAGASEVPPTDSGASGSFTATLDPAKGQLCYDLEVSGLDTPTAAHIHVGPAGQNGGPVVVLAAPADGSAKACTAVEPDVAAKLIASPQDYYVNVHNAAYPKGGARGQLSK